jgi:hypothetical protein
MSAPHLPKCVYQTSDVVDGMIGCSNTKDLIHPGLVPEQFCYECPYRTHKRQLTGLGDVVEKGLSVVGVTKELVQKLTGREDCGCHRRQAFLNRLVQRNIYPLSKGFTEWAVGITAAPRFKSSVMDTVKSLKATGFSDLYVFAEPRTAVKKAGVTWVQRPDTVAECLFTREQLGDRGQFGAHQNFCQTIADLLVLNPKAEAVLYVQDDVRFCLGLRDYLEHNLWPDPDTGCVSLYSPNFKGYISHRPQAIQIKHKNLVGALAMAFPRSVAEAMVKHPLVHDWQGYVGRPGRRGSREPYPWERKALDAAIGHMMIDMGKKVFFYSPSMAEHFEPRGAANRNSSVGNGANQGKRKEYRFIGNNVHVAERFSPRTLAYNIPSGEQRVADPPKLDDVPVLVIIPGVDAPERTIKCIEHVKASDHPTRILYIDNGSTKQNFLEVCEALRPDDEPIRFELNQGFTAAIQEGFDLRVNFPHSAVLLLNNDCYVSSTCITKLRQHMVLHEGCAAINPLTCDRGISSLRQGYNQRRARIQSYSTDANMTQGVLDQSPNRMVAVSPMLPWFCTLITPVALDQVDQLPKAESLRHGLGVDDWWCKMIQANERWKCFQSYNAYAVHEHSSTFRQLGLDRRKLSQDAVKALKSGI